MEYGRRSEAGTWFQTKPVGVLGALLLTMITTGAVAQYRYVNATAIQRAYLPVYVRAELASHVGLSRDGTYALGLTPNRYRHQDVAAWLQSEMFHGQSLGDLAMPVLQWTASVGVTALLIGMLIDRRRARAPRQGRYLRGTEFVSTREFSRRIKRGTW